MNRTEYDKLNMTMKESMTGFLLGMAAGFIIIMAFYGNAIAAILVGTAAGGVSVRLYKNKLIEDRKKALLMQFKSMLEALTASYSAGKITQTAFRDCQLDMVNIYGEDADIVKELKIINAGIYNGMTCEKLLKDFAKRSGLEDIINFADFFEICNRRGANIGRVIVNARNSIGTKIEMEQEIENLLTPGKQELKILAVMPLADIPFINGSSFTNGMSSGMAFVSKTIALGLFIIAIIIGWKISKIDV